MSEGGSDAARAPDQTQLPERAPRQMDSDGDSSEATSREGLRDRERDARAVGIMLEPKELGRGKRLTQGWAPPYALPPGRVQAKPFLGRRQIRGPGGANP